MSPRERRRIPGIKPERGDLILAAATVIETRDGPRRRRRHRGHPGRPARGRVLRDAARRPGRAAVRRRPRGQRPQPRRRSTTRTSPTPSTSRRLALEIWDGAGARPGSTPATPRSASCCGPRRCSHDVGTAVDYDDHHKHSRYLILNAGLPGYSPRETALIGQAARYHRKGRPALREFAPLARKGDEALLVPRQHRAAARRAARARARPDRPPRRAHRRRRRRRARARVRRRRHREPLGGRPPGGAVPPGVRPRAGGPRYGANCMT